MMFFSQTSFDKESVNYLSFDISIEFEVSNKIIFVYKGIGKIYN